MDKKYNGGGEWRHGLCDCFDSCGDCLFSYCLGPCYACTIAEKAGEGSCMGFLNCLFYPWCLCCLRQKIRESKGIDGSCLGDCFATQCCACCAAIQMKREFD